MKTIQTIDRAMLILEHISKNKDSRLVDMCTAFGLNKSTLHGILSTLEYHGLIHKDTVNATYNLGAKVFELGKTYEDNLSIKRIAKPYLELLCSKFDETVHLAILSESEVLYIDKVESQHPFRMTSRVGTKDPLVYTAIGKAILANLSPVKIDTLIETIELKSATDYSATDKNKIKSELKIVHKQGFAIDLEELEVGLNCLAVPVKGPNNEAMAAISIVIPSSRFEKDKFESMKIDLIEACNNISKDMGF